MNIHEYYVSLETARLLKEAGFDWEVSHWYADKPDDKELYEDYAKSMNANQYMDPYHYYQAFSAPTLEVAQRWLREVKRVEVYAHVFYDSYDMSNGWNVYVYEVNHITKQIEDWITSYDVYHSYEEALEAGIKKCLTLILEEGELK